MDCNASDLTCFVSPFCYLSFFLLLCTQCIPRFTFQPNSLASSLELPKNFVSPRQTKDSIEDNRSPSTLRKSLTKNRLPWMAKVLAYRYRCPTLLTRVMKHGNDRVTGYPNHRSPDAWSRNELRPRLDWYDNVCRTHVYGGEQRRAQVKRANLNDS